MKPRVWRKRSGIAAVALLSSLSCSPAASFSFTNASLLVINDSQTPPTIAAPYPSTIPVTGLTGMVVIKVTVTLWGLSHEFPSDIGMLLVGPQGQETVLMASVGGQNKYSVTNLTLTLDDDASSSLPVYSALVSGTFKPTNGYLGLTGYTNVPYDFPPPAPPGNSNAPARLSVFKNTDPTGPWRLFVVDDVAGGAGALSNGWSLNLSAAVPLSLVRAQTNVVISWTNAVQGCTLQSTPNLAATWTNALPAPVVVGGRYTATNPIGPGNAFYRLVK